MATERQRKWWAEDGKFIMSAGESAGIDMELLLAARLTDEETAKQIQPWLGYVPQPPFGGIDYDGVGLTPRSGRACVSLTAPLLTARPKRLTSRERAKGTHPMELNELGGRR